MDRTQPGSRDEILAGFTRELRASSSDRCIALLATQRSRRQDGRQGLPLRGGSGLSRHALAAGYAARVRESGIERLRAVCDADPGQADRSLTLDFAAYLVGAGATPLLDPMTQGAQPSRPGSIDAPSFYVEVRQVQSVYPAAVVRRACTQLWGTWRRFRKLRRCDEAFLVVFCRRGRRVELPIELDLDGLTVYSASIDLRDRADHPDRSTAIRFNAAKLHL